MTVDRTREDLRQPAGDDARKARPRLAPGVTVHPPAEDGAPWVVQDQHGKYLRVAKDLARLLGTIDGERDHEELAAVLGPPWGPEQVGQVVDSVWERGLLDTGETTRAHNDLVRFVPPFTIQFTMLHPDRVLQAALPLIRLAAAPASRVLAAVLLIAGAVSAAVQAPTLFDALSRPLPLSAIIGVMVATYLTTILHEFAHGAVLVYHGGRPTRMGVMLFYLLPAFFCDVSDGWRLPHRRQRVQIALAGIAVQLLAASLAAVTALALQLGGVSGDLYVTLLLYSGSVAVSGVLNLLPFVKLDGYIALMAWLDRPSLRDRAMDRARERVGTALFGGTRPGRAEEPAAPRWMTAYGVACQLFPVLLITLALGLWTDMLQGTGVPGAIVVCAVILGVVFYAVRALVRVVREAAGRGAPAGRVAGVLALVGATLTAALTLITVPHHAVGGYVADEDGPRITLLSEDAVDAVSAGDPVRIERRGLITRAPGGSGTVGDADAEITAVRLSALVPVFEDNSSDPLLVDVYALPLEPDTLDPELAFGTAVIDTGERPALGQWLYLRFIAPIFTY